MDNDVKAGVKYMNIDEEDNQECSELVYKIEDNELNTILETQSEETVNPNDNGENLIIGTARPHLTIQGKNETNEFLKALHETKTKAPPNCLKHPIT